MTEKNLKSRKKQIQELISNGKSFEASDEIYDLITELFSDQDYSKIVDLFHSRLCEPKTLYYHFEVAFSLNREGFTDEAEIIYEELLNINPNNTAVLNNLSLIKKFKGKIEDAFDLLKKGYDLDPHDEYIAKNYKDILPKYEKTIRQKEMFKAACQYLAKENDFIIKKLKTFLSNVNKDATFKLNKLPIPTWKFSVLMNTDKQKAESLKEQWLDKGYILNTDERGDYFEYVYEINPYLEEALSKIVQRKVNDKWIGAIDDLNIEKLETINYFEILGKIEKINKKYRLLIKRDFDELVFNWIMKNEKSIVVLAGSLVELILIYYCEKKKVNEISYLNGCKSIKRKIYMADLSDLLMYFQQNNILSDLLVHLGNISRINRNYIHPGKEIRDDEMLDISKANLCFMSCLEIVKLIL